MAITKCIDARNQGLDIPDTGGQRPDSEMASDTSKDREKLLVSLSSLREKELLLNHLQNKGLTNEEVENIKGELVKTIKELEALDVQDNI